MRLGYPDLIFLMVMIGLWTFMAYFKGRLDGVRSMKKIIDDWAERNK